VPWDGHSWTQGDSVKDRKSEVDDDNDELVPDCGLSDGHDVVSNAGVMTIVRLTVKAVVGVSRNIRVTAAGGE
jgi:hypothetical protein